MLFWCPDRPQPDSRARPRSLRLLDLPRAPPDDQLRLTLPPVTVTAQKEPEDARRLPVSVTAVSKDTIDRADIQIVSEAGIFAPNVTFTEFTARKLSNPRFRGIGSSPANPAVTTFLDGVPQLNSNSSSVDLLDVEQIEFVRGPQSALFGRNTLGGLINVASRKPTLGKWTGQLSVPFGNFANWELRGNASGALIADTLSASAAFTYAERDGFTTNDVTGQRHRLAQRRSAARASCSGSPPTSGRRASSSPASARATATTR